MTFKQCFYVCCPERVFRRLLHNACKTPSNAITRDTSIRGIILR